MTTLNWSYRDVEVTDQVIQTAEGDVIEATLYGQLAEPWFVFDSHGRLMLAYGPWKVVEFDHNTMKQVTIMRVLRWHWRRTSADLSKYPMGEPWDHKKMGVPYLAKDQKAVSHKDGKTAFSKQQFGSQIT